MVITNRLDEYLSRPHFKQGASKDRHKNHHYYHQVKVKCRPEERFRLPGIAGDVKSSD